MKLNISYPATGCQTKVEVEDDKKLVPFFDKRISAEVAGDSLGEEYTGYVFRITGGNDKQGFPMKQGVLTDQRVRLLFKKGMSCYRERRKGMRKRKSVRGCQVSPAISVLNLVVVKKGDNEIPGLTDEVKPRTLGPKRATRIRKLFNLTKQDDVRKYVVRHEKEGKDGKKVSKAPKIQRLVTENRLRRKRFQRSQMLKAIKAGREDRAAYEQKLSAYRRELREKRAAEVAKKKKASGKAAEMEERRKKKEAEAKAKKEAAEKAAKAKAKAKAPAKAGKAPAKAPAKAAGKAAAKAPAAGKAAAKAPAAKAAAPKAQAKGKAKAAAKKK